MAQTFYQEPGENSQWVPRLPSDCRPRPEPYNVSDFFYALARSAYLKFSSQILARPHSDLRLVGISSVPMVTPNMYPESGRAPPLTQGHITSQALSVEHNEFHIKDSPEVLGNSTVATSAIQGPARSQHNSRRTQRSTRAHNPVRGQRTGHARECKGGRTRGAPNYKIREVEALLDIVEEELPVAAKGWRVVGARFRDWATVTQFPARTDRSLELKFKQVSFSSASNIKCRFSQHSRSFSRWESQVAMLNAHPRSTVHMRWTERSSLRRDAGILRMEKLLKSIAMMVMSPMMRCLTHFTPMSKLIGVVHPLAMNPCGFVLPV